MLRIKNQDKKTSLLYMYIHALSIYTYIYIHIIYIYSNQYIYIHTLNKVYDRNVVNKYIIYLLLGAITFNRFDYIYSGTSDVDYILYIYSGTSDVERL